MLPRPALRVLPAEQRLAAGAPHERLGVQPLRRPGLGGDLRELREHAPGDPFKQIAWKATARTGKLMVRELDRETMVTHWLCVDIGGTMRDGRPGAARLDLAVDVAAAYARGALDAGDRVGLVTFDGRIVGEAKANDGPVHRLRIVERLMEAMNVVDEDLTELTDSELVAVVGRYLLLQEGIDARLRRAPPIDSPVWNELAASPSGELYNLRVVQEAVTAAIDRHRKELGAPARRSRCGCASLPSAWHRAALSQHAPRPAIARAASAPRSSTPLRPRQPAHRRPLGSAGARGRSLAHRPRRAPGAPARPPPDLRRARGAPRRRRRRGQRRRRRRRRICSRATSAAASSRP